MASRRTPTLDEEVPQTMMNRLPASFRPRPRRAHLLEQTAGPGSPARHELSADALIIGRGSTADLRLDSDDVSRTHAQLLRIEREGRRGGVGARRAAGRVFGAARGETEGRNSRPWAPWTDECLTDERGGPA